jgi:prepilin-type N-terminal cleavage/methylation domain-containing protein
MNTPNCPRLARGFSLVELLASIAIIGLLAFMAIPRVVEMQSKGEESLAISRAESLNMATATMVQVQGISQASLLWSGKTADQRYVMVKDYLAFGETALAYYLPNGYTVAFSNSLEPLTKVILRDPAGTQIRY